MFCKKKDDSLSKCLWFGLVLAVMLMGSLCRNVGVSHAEDTIRIGILAPMNTIYGKQILPAVEIAIDEVNKSGGVLGKKFEYIGAEDTAFKLDQSVSGAKSLVREDAYAVIGGFANQGVMACQPIFTRSKVFFFNCGSAGSVISEMLKKNWDQRKYWFRVSLNNSTFEAMDYVNAATALMKDKFGFTKIALIPEDATWTEAQEEVMLKEFPKRGIEVVYHQRWPIDTTDFSPIFSKIMKTDAEFIGIVISHNDGVQLSSQWYDKKIPLVLFGGSSYAMLPNYWKMTDGKCYSQFAWKFTFGDRIAITPKTKSFSKKFSKAFGSGAMYQAYGAYDAVHILAEAIKRAGTLDKEKVFDEVEKTSWVGPIGTIEFYGKEDKYPHDVKAVADGFEDGVQLIWAQWFKERLECVWPDDLKTAEPFLPPWIKAKK